MERNLLKKFKSEFLFGILEDKSLVENLKAGNLPEMINFIRTFTDRMNEDRSKKEVLILLSLIAVVQQTTNRVVPHMKKESEAISEMVVLVGRDLQSPRHAWGAMTEKEESYPRYHQH